MNNNLDVLRAPKINVREIGDNYFVASISNRNGVRSGLSRDRDEAIRRVSITKEYKIKTPAWRDDGD
jgi:hypothetical protein